jgi:RNA polymerase sigma-70 factor, ECF subfamily
MQTARRAHDGWLALRCQAGEPRAFEDLCAEMEQPLFYYALKLVGNQDTALDILQETWVRAVRGIRQLKDPESVRSWLYSVAHGAAIDQIRRERARQRAETDYYGQMPELADPLEFTFVDAQAVHVALDQLSQKHREVLVLHFMEEFSLAEIALIVGCPEGTVKSRMFNAKWEMWAILSGGGYAVGS